MAQILLIQCKNPECGQRFKVPRPEKPGVVPFTCPYCSMKMKVRFQGVPKEVKIGGNPKADAPTEPSPNPQPKGGTTVADHSQDAPIAVDKDLEVGSTAMLNCPHCGAKMKFAPKAPGKRTVNCARCKGAVILSSVEPEPIEGIYDVTQTADITCPGCGHVNSYKPEKEGKNGFFCEECQKRIVVKAQMKTRVFGPVVPPTDSALLAKGRLVQVRHWPRRDNVFALRDGSNIIGRADRQLPSEISIKDDPTMSRQSVEIDVRRTSMGYQYKFTVLRAANEILLNNKPLQVGESEPLKFGDIIKMGHTKFRFEKEK